MTAMTDIQIDILKNKQRFIGHARSGWFVVLPASKQRNTVFKKGDETIKTSRTLALQLIKTHHLVLDSETMCAKTYRWNDKWGSECQR